MNQKTVHNAMDNLSSLLNYTAPAAGQNNASGALVFRTTVTSPFPLNRIIFGAPGTGKSHTLEKDSEALLPSPLNYERVTFHPDYTYAQFVGGYKPVTDENGEIRYKFVAGPFTRVLTAALANARTDNPQPFLLIVEEINRARVAAVFGDIFQLLDRDEYGVSDYHINVSEEMKRYLCEKLNIEPAELTELRIPNNMFIWASMNSADQGVYPMDTAFKRRWSFEYLDIDSNQQLIRGRITLGTGEKAKDIEWNRLRRAINERMSADFHINEDKLLGPFFLSKDAIATDDTGRIKNPAHFINSFKSKVLMYLFEDAAKQHRNQLFDGCNASRYSGICSAFDALGIEIFGESFIELYNQIGD